MDVGMDLGIIRGAGTATLLLSFVALCVWAWLPAQKRRFDEAARLPFLDEEPETGRPDTGAGEAFGRIAR